MHNCSLAVEFYDDHYNVSDGFTLLRRKYGEYLSEAECQNLIKDGLKKTLTDIQKQEKA